MERSGDIYVITCKTTNKQYVGQALHTKLNRGKYIEHGMMGRWKDHIWESTSSKYCQCLALNNAIKKYGHDNFSVVKLENCKNQQELNDKEQFWINKLNSLAPNGYNLSLGGTNRHATIYTKQQLSIMTKQYFENEENVKTHSKRIENFFTDKRITFFKDKHIIKASIRNINTSSSSPPHIRVYVYYNDNDSDNIKQTRTNFHYKQTNKDEGLNRARTFVKQLTSNIEELV